MPHRVRPQVGQRSPQPFDGTESESRHPPSRQEQLRDVEGDGQSDAGGDAELAQQPEADAVKHRDAEHALREIRRETRLAHRRQQPRDGSGRRLPQQQRGRRDVERGQQTVLNGAHVPGHDRAQRSFERRRIQDDKDRRGRSSNAACDHQPHEELRAGFAVLEQSRPARADAQQEESVSDPEPAGVQLKKDPVLHRFGQVQCHQLARRTFRLDLELLQRAALELLGLRLLLFGRLWRSGQEKGAEHQSGQVQDQDQRRDHQRPRAKLVYGQQQQSKQRVDHQDVAAEEQAVHETDPHQDQQSPGVAARKGLSGPARPLELDREAQAEQEREDRKELALDQDRHPLGDHAIQCTEAHEVRYRGRTDQKSGAGMRHDDAEQRDGSQRIDDDETIAGLSSRGGSGLAHHFRRVVV